MPSAPTLWSLVHAGILQHTIEAPILYRLADPNDIIEDIFAYLDGDGIWRCNDCKAQVPLNLGLVSQRIVRVVARTAIGSMWSLEAEVPTRGGEKAILLENTP
ncbi:hypothetical protein ACFL6C_04950 [Myxococcota bacterium]